MKLTVGQTLVVSSRNREPNPGDAVVVATVGRKYATVVDADDRIDMESMTIERKNGRAWGHVYESIEAFYAAKAATEMRKTTRRLWDQFKTRLPYFATDDMTIEDIKAAAELLKISLEGT